MKKIYYFATTNNDKLKEFNNFLNPRGIFVEKIALEIPEVRHDDVADVARDKARYAVKKVGKTIVVEDSGLFITALGGFPGPCTAYSYEKLKFQGIMKLLEGEERSAYEVSAIAFCEPGKEPVVFVGRADGTISGAPRGEGGFGYDPIFIPKGYIETYAEAPKLKYKISHRAKSLAKLADFLEKK